MTCDVCDVLRAAAVTVCLDGLAECGDGCDVIVVLSVGEAEGQPAVAVVGARLKGMS